MKLLREIKAVTVDKEIADAQKVKRFSLAALSCFMVSKADVTDKLHTKVTSDFFTVRLPQLAGFSNSRFSQGLPFYTLTTF